MRSYVPVSAEKLENGKIRVGYRATSSKDEKDI